MNAALAACVTNSEMFGKDAYADYSKNITQYYEFCRTNNLFVTHASINPQIDRSKTTNQIPHKNSAVRVVNFDSKGIVVSGAKMIGTLSAISDEIFIFNMPGLKTEDLNSAIAFAIPTTSKAIQIILRKSMIKKDFHDADYPISSLLDTMDSMIIFDNAKIPWERVFIFKNVKISNSFYDTTKARHHTGHQGIVRMLSLLELLCGAATELA